MTSKNCCFNLMKEDLKRRLWLISLLALVFMFAYPVAVTALIGEYSPGMVKGSDSWLYMLGEIQRYHSPGNGMIMFIVLMASIICGISSFSYLYSKKKVDLYHSIPAKRSALFWAHYLNGIIIFVLLFGISLMVSLLIVTVNGAFTPSMLTTAFTCWLLHSAFYILLYSTVTAAVMMTGNIIISILGIVIFFAYVPAVVVLTEGYFQMWFETYYSSGFALELLKVSSPYAYYISQIETMSVHGIAIIMAVTLAAAAVITLLTLWMYTKRPSEAAGKAMAFEKTKTAIKILLVIPFSMAGCILFWGINDSFGWALFGLLVFGILSHFVIEIIYSFDFRCLFANKRHLLVCLLASVLLFVGFVYDITGFDRYVPKKDSLESAAISVYSLDDWVTYGSPVPVYDSYDSSSPQYSYWNYMDGTDYIFDHMEIREVEPVLLMAQAAVDMDKEGGESIGGYRANIRYNMKSGRKVYRSIRIPADEFEAVSRMYLDQDYKQGVFPLMKQTIDDTSSVSYQEMSHVTSVPTTDQADIGMLLDTYKEELGGLSLETRKAEMPIGMIQFRTHDMEAMLKQDTDNKSDIAQRSYYPVYPSFKNTISLLRSQGIDPGSKLKVDKITKIVVTDSYNDIYRNTVQAEPVSPIEQIEGQKTGDATGIIKSLDEDGYMVYEFHDKAEIARLFPCLVPSDYADLNSFCDYDYDMTVSLEYGEGLDQYSYRFVMIPDRLPDELKNLFESNRNREE